MTFPQIKSALDGLKIAIEAASPSPSPSPDLETVRKQLQLDGMQRALMAVGRDRTLEGAIAALTLELRGVPRTIHASADPMRGTPQVAPEFRLLEVDGFLHGLELAGKMTSHGYCQALEIRRALTIQIAQGA